MDYGEGRSGGVMYEFVRKRVSFVFNGLQRRFIHFIQIHTPFRTKGPIV
jgi:hypothetical protein